MKRSAGKAAVGTSLIPTEVLKTILKTSIDYNSLILHLMAGPFSIMPVEIGGDLASGSKVHSVTLYLTHSHHMPFPFSLLAYSLNDPLFILHLAFIDKLWLEWEKLDGSSTRFVRGYEGIERRKWPHRDRIVSTNDLVVIEGSVSDVPVIHLLDPRNSYLCCK